MLCADLSARLVEVNVNPSTATEHAVDRRVKYWMLRDMLGLVGVPAPALQGRAVVPRRGERCPSALRAPEFRLRPGEKRLSRAGEPPSRYEEALLAALRAERARRGAFQPLFPAPAYADFFETKRHLNGLAESALQ